MLVMLPDVRWQDTNTVAYSAGICDDNEKFYAVGPCPPVTSMSTPVVLSMK